MSANPSRRRSRSPLPASVPIVAVVGFLGMLLTVSHFPGSPLAPSAADAQEASNAQETAEMFHVSRVGRANSAETREVLGAIYGEVAAEYNERIAREQADQNSGQKFKGERIRILRSMRESSDDGSLYLCAYNGSPCVFAIPGDALPGGELSPPLANIAANGEHTTEIVRMVADPNANRGQAPALQKVDTSSGSGVTFFGIPLDTGGGGGGSSQPVERAPEPGMREVKETRTLPLYKATISTEPLAEGPPPMSQDLFLSMVKNGEIFTVEQLELRRCQGCRGFGRVHDTVNGPGNRDPDGKMNCPECGGHGKIYWNVTYKVGW